MKKIGVLILIFLIYTLVVKFCPQISQFDENLIINVQNLLRDIPLALPILAGAELYRIMIFLPIAGFDIYFFRKYLLIDMVLISTIPAVTYFFNKIFKAIVQRPRPPLELQLGEHSASFSFVSNHTIVTCSVWGLTIYYLLKYCKNRFLKIAGVCFGVFWIVFEGFSRVWLGVHNPTDVFGGYFLGIIFVLIYIRLAELIGGK